MGAPSWRLARRRAALRLARCHCALTPPNACADTRVGTHAHRPARPHLPPSSARGWLPSRHRNAARPLMSPAASPSRPPRPCSDPQQRARTAAWTAEIPKCPPASPRANPRRPRWPPARQQTCCGPDLRSAAQLQPQSQYRSNKKMPAVAAAATRRPTKAAVALFCVRWMAPLQMMMRCPNRPPPCQRDAGPSRLQPSCSPLPRSSLARRRERPVGATKAELLLVGGLEDTEGAHQALVHRHHRARVVKLAAVVGGGEDGDELPVGEELVAVLDDLVRTHDQVVVVLLQELAHDVGAERVRHPAVILSPT
mmetsp:Transcript_50943/g.134763  ORF Transcript_50943/g.134763 Transcript_50943/m.134763 type:complete len:310 (-) Transcript_50943:693-1622(-)